MVEVFLEDDALRIEFPDGKAITVENVQPGIVFKNTTQRALFLEDEEAETLKKMIRYILEKVRITPESADALRAIQPRLDEAFTT